MSDKLREAMKILATEDAVTINKSLDEKLMAASENLYSLACEVEKLQAENEALVEAIKKFKSNPITKNKYAMFDLMGDE